MSVSKTFTFNVAMSCGGCSGAVTKALKRVEGAYIPTSPPLPFRSPPRLMLFFSFTGAGVEDVVIDMVGQKVTVTGVVPKETMFSAIEETGKAVSYTDESHCVE